MKKILYTTFDTIPAPKGSSVHTTYFLKALSKEYEVELYCLGEQDQKHEGYYNNVKVSRFIDIPKNWLEKAITFGENVLNKVSNTKYDIVHFRSLWDGYPLCVYKDKGDIKPYLIYEVNGLPSIELKYHYPVPSKLIEKIIKQEIFTLNTVNHIICQSKVTFEYLKRLGINENKISVIPNGVDTNLFSPEDLEVNQTNTILYIGTLAPWQGLSDLLRAIPLLKKWVNVRIIGKSKLIWQTKLNELSVSLGISRMVSIEGPLPYEMIPKIINSSTICVAPLNGCDRNIIQGCFPIKILEYMSCSKPTIAADIPAIREIIEHEKDGLLYRVDSKEELAQYINNLLDNPEKGKKLGERARLKVQKNFTWEKACQNLLDFYKQL